MSDQPEQKPEEKAPEAVTDQPTPTQPEVAEATEAAKADSAVAEEEVGAPVEDEAAIAEQEALAKQQAAEEALAAEEAKAQDLRPGMTVRVHQRIQEGEKDRIQVFQGIIIAMRGKTPATKTMTVQKQSFGVMVEKIFPLASPMIEKIEVVKVAKVRRSKLYYLRDYRKRLKETLVKQ